MLCEVQCLLTADTGIIIIPFTQVIETSVTTDKSFQKCSAHSDDHTIVSSDTPGLKQFTIIITIIVNGLNPGVSIVFNISTRRNYTSIVDLQIMHTERAFCYSVINLINYLQILSTRRCILIVFICHVYSSTNKVLLWMLVNDG